MGDPVPLKSNIWSQTAAFESSPCSEASTESPGHVVTVKPVEHHGFGPAIQYYSECLTSLQPLSPMRLAPHLLQSLPSTSSGLHSSSMARTPDPDARSIPRQVSPTKEV